MQEQNESHEAPESTSPPVNFVKKIGLGVAGFLICWVAALFSSALISIVLGALGVRGVSQVAGLVLAIGPTYMIYEEFKNHHIRIGGRIALGVWTGSVIAGAIWSLVA